MPPAVIATLLLCPVFLVAGIAKLADLRGSQKALLDFGVWKWLAGPLAVLLPASEVIVGAGLISSRFDWYASIGALALLTAFVIAIAINLIRGRKPDCHCFGQIHSKPIGWGLAIRNAVLAAIAGIVVYAGPTHTGLAETIATVVAGHEILFTFGLAVLIVMSAHCWLTFQLLKQGGRLLVRMEGIERGLATHGAGRVPANSSAQAHAEAPGLKVGEDAPSFSLRDLDGRVVPFPAARESLRPTIALFASPDCAPCASLLPNALAWHEQAAEHFDLLILSKGSIQQNLEKFKGVELRQVLLQRQNEVAEAYRSSVTPSALVLRRDGTIGSPLAQGPEEIQALVANLINEEAAGPALGPLKPGDAAPRLRYPDLNGMLVRIAGAEDRMKLILFWNPACGFCRQMAADVNIWHETWRPPKPEIRIISTGSVEENRKMNLRPAVLLDRGFTAGEAFQVRGTPSAVLLDEHGRVSSRLAVGRDEIMALV